jgi:hypothetical protein
MFNGARVFNIREPEWSSEAFVSSIEAINPLFNENGSIIVNVNALKGKARLDGNINVLSNGNSVSGSNITYSEEFAGEKSFVFKVPQLFSKDKTVFKIVVNSLFPFNMLGDGYYEQRSEVESTLNSKPEWDVGSIISKTLEIPKKTIFYPSFMEKEPLFIYECINFDNLIDIQLTGLNIFPEKLFFLYNGSDYSLLEFEYSEAYLLLKDIYLDSDIEVLDGSTKYPLEIEQINTEVHFKLKNTYYFNALNDTLFATNQANTTMVDYIPLPLNKAEEKITYQIVIKGALATYTTINIRSTMRADLDLFGLCDSSKYCIRRSDNKDFAEYGEENRI